MFGLVIKAFNLYFKRFQDLKPVTKILSLQRFFKINLQHFKFALQSISSNDCCIYSK